MCNFISFYPIKEILFAENKAIELLWDSFMWYNNFKRLKRSRYLKVVFHRLSSCLSFKTLYGFIWFYKKNKICEKFINVLLTHFLLRNWQSENKHVKMQICEWIDTTQITPQNILVVAKGTRICSQPKSFSDIRKV